MRGLELVVSKAFESIAEVEDRLVNSAYASGFAIKHPVAASVFTSAGLAGVITYLYSNVLPLGVKLGIDVYTLAIPVAVAGTGFMIYDLARQHREVADAGLPVESFYELGRNVVGTRKAALALSLVSLSAANAYAYYHSGIPLETLLRMDAIAAPASYLAARAFMNALKPISSLTSFKAAATEVLAFLASKATGNRQFHTKALERNARNFPSARTKMELAEAYLDAGRLDDGLLQAKEAMEHGAELPPLFFPRAGRKRIEAAAKAHRAIRNGNASHADYVEFSRSCSAVGETGKAEQAITQMAQRFPSIESDILAAVFLDAAGNGEKAAAYWNSAVSSILSKPELSVLPVSEQGVHNTRRYGPTPIIASTFVFKGADSQGQHDFEKHAIQHVSQILKSSFYTLPQVVAEFAHRNGSTSYELVLRYLEGQSPAEMSRAGTLSRKHVLSIIDYLSWIHKNVKPELSRKGRVSLDAKLEQILHNPHLGLPEALAESIKEDIGFIIEEQKSSPYVFAKDPHPAQWRFGRGQLAALDWEDKGATPLFVDSAKLYIHPDIPFSEEELDEFHCEAAALYSCNLSGSDSEFRERQLDAMLFQALSFASAWSLPEMSHMRGKRAGVLERAQQAFSMVKQNHSSRYSSNKSRYDALEDNFKGISDLLVA